MSIRREQILVRVRTILCDLEHLSEGGTQSWDSHVHVQADSRAPVSPEGNTLDRMVAQLETWCDKAEGVAMRERVGNKPEATNEEIAFRILNDYAGRHHQLVAEDLGVAVSTVSETRKAAGLDRVYGIKPV